MSYTAFIKMRQLNQARFNIADPGPHQPVRHYDTVDCGLKAMALRFLHSRCEELLFDPGKEQEEKEKGIFLGTSLRPNEIPYNMQMDINRLCLERELEKFIDSGVAEDAYNIYYCYLEMFFGHYGKSKKMVELLSEFEANGSSLLMKHRDHFSHFVYVFALGLAIYESNTHFRRIFKEFYNFDPDENNQAEDHRAAGFFLEYWGLTSLFHDIGYPFELPFEQILSYFEVAGKDRNETGIYLAYHNMETITTLSGEAAAYLGNLFHRPFKTTEELFAWGVTQRLGKMYNFEEDYILDKIHNKPIKPNTFGFYMDHAYFSVARLFQEIEKSLGPDRIKQVHLDALTAILLHNSLFKFAICFFKAEDPQKRKEPLPISCHPLAWLLMLCDELQCWDRTAYGRNSRTELHPMAADFDFRNNAIHAVYYYDRDEQEKIEEFKIKYRKWEDEGEAGKPPRLKAYSDMAEKEQRFVRDIEKIVDTRLIPLVVVPNTRFADRKNKHIYLSTSNFLHLYDFAVALNARFAHIKQEKETDSEILENSFEELSLEYQLSNINQAKQFSTYLNVIGCFFTDRPVDYDMVTSFTMEQVLGFAPMEHCRWSREHYSMAWESGELYNTLPLPDDMLKCFGTEINARKALREQMRMHSLLLPGNPKDEELYSHFAQLPEDEKKKDYEPFNSMLKLIRKFDGLRIYSLK